MAILNNDDGKKDKRTNRINQMREAAAQGLAGQTYDLNVPVVDLPFSSPDQQSFTSFTDAGRQYQQAVPSYNVNDLFSNKLSMTPDPVRDAAQEQRLQKQAKFNQLSKGLQLLFGSVISATGGVSPAPYDDGMTQTIANAMQNLDDKYFQELAQVRDINLRAKMFNSEQDRRRDEARLQERREKYKRQGEIDDLEAARTFERGMFDETMDYKYAALNQDRKNQERNYNLSLFRAGKEDKDYGMVPQSDRPIFDEYIKRKISELENSKEGLIDTKNIDEQIEDYRSLSYNFSDKSGLPERVYREAKMWETQQNALKNRENDILNGILTGQYSGSPGRLQEDLTQFYLDNGFSEKEAQQNSINYMKEIGLGGQTKIEAPQPGDYSSPSDYVIAKKEWDVNRQERAVQSNIDEKRGVLGSEFASALSLIDDLELSKDLNENFRGHPEQAIESTIKELRKRQAKVQEREQVTSLGTRFGSTALSESNKYASQIRALEYALQDLKNATTR